jgi:hypothetical protein
MLFTYRKAQVIRMFLLPGIGRMGSAAAMLLNPPGAVKLCNDDTLGKQDNGSRKVTCVKSSLGCSILG